MAITFIQQKKIQRILIGAFLLVIFITAAVLWLGFFKKASVPTPSETQLPSLPKVELDFGVFESPLFQSLQEPEDALGVPEQIGRNNPFIPY